MRFIQHSPNVGILINDITMKKRFLRTLVPKKLASGVSKYIYVYVTSPLLLTFVAETIRYKKKILMLVGKIRNIKN